LPLQSTPPQLCIAAGGQLAPPPLQNEASVCTSPLAVVAQLGSLHCVDEG
jgi:hypothetical protein